MRFHRVASVAGATLLSLACAAAALAGDIIQKRDGTYVPAVKNSPPTASDLGESKYVILGASLKEVAYQIPVPQAGGGVKMATQTMPADQVAELWLDPSRYPPEWKTANEALDAGDGARSAALFKAIGDAKNVNPVVRQKALLLFARVNANYGKNPEGPYHAVLKEFPECFYSKAVRRELASWFMDNGLDAKALAEIDEFLKLPGLTQADQIEARYLKTTVGFRKAVAAKDAAGIQKAYDEYKDLAAQTTGNKELAGVNNLARLGMGNCLLEMNKSGDAKALFQDLAEKAANTETALLAAAFNGLGECWFREGGPAAWAEARLCFLRTSLMYSEGATADDLAKAMYSAGECFFKLQDSEDWKTCSARELNECVRRFPSSRWAGKAKILLLNLK